MRSSGLKQGPQNLKHPRRLIPCNGKALITLEAGRLRGHMAGQASRAYIFRISRTNNVAPSDAFFNSEVVFFSVTIYRRRFFLVLSLFLLGTHRACHSKIACNQLKRSRPWRVSIG